MKKIVTVLVLFMITAPALLAQESLREVVRDYQRKNREFTMVIPSFMFKMGLAYGDLEDDEKELLEQINKMKIVFAKNGFRNHDFQLLNEGVKNGNFNEILTVYDKKNLARMIIHEKNEKKSELLMLVEDGHESVMILMDLHGKPDFSKFISLAD
ncbi:MAG: DUF4252 domain-containing protein [Thiohalospira sp.]